jgi:hypothetical protein
MSDFRTEKLLAAIIAIGTCFTAIFVVSGSVTDPVNATKLLVLGVVAASAFGLVLVSGIKDALLQSRLLWVVSLTFLIAASVSVMFSGSPISQGIYGSYGRNNGLLAYLFLVGMLLSTAALSRAGSIKKLIDWLLVAGVVNVIYCLWVIVFGDFIGWSNPYGNILGTFGNPNFIGSFLGIFLAVCVGYGLSNSSPRWLKYFLLVIVPVSIFEIYESNAIQGRVVGVTGLAIVGFFYLRARFKIVVTWVYVLIAGIAGLAAMLGALQIGPLTALIYKASVSLRGQYWLAGWNTGELHPWTGVGMDAFGDWYRRTRDPMALEIPGVNTVVNAAHNVPIDMFAFGGWPLFIAYLMIMLIGGVAITRMVVRTKAYDPILVALTTSWVGYHLQSIISINQIGLAIWGWVLTGAVISYERITREINPVSIPSKTSQKNSKTVRVSEGVHAKRILVTSTLGIIGLLLSLPPITADSKWRKAQVIQSVETLEESMNQSYFNPQNTMKFVTNIQILEQSNLPERAHKYALEAVNWNPESFDLWKLLFLIKNSSVEERSLALANMKRLDPLNPDVAALQ